MSAPGPAPFTAPGFVMSGGDLVPPFVPRPRAVILIDNQLRAVAEKRAKARGVIRDGLRLLRDLDAEEDSLLELRSVEAARRA